MCTFTIQTHQVHEKPNSHALAESITRQRIFALNQNTDRVWDCFCFLYLTDASMSSRNYTSRRVRRAVLFQALPLTYHIGLRTWFLFAVDPCHDHYFCYLLYFKRSLLHSFVFTCFPFLQKTKKPIVPVTKKEVWYPTNWEKYAELEEKRGKSQQSCKQKTPQWFPSIKWCVNIQAFLSLYPKHCLYETPNKF